MDISNSNPYIQYLASFFGYVILSIKLWMVILQAFPIMSFRWKYEYFINWHYNILSDKALYFENDLT